MIKFKLLNGKAKMPSQATPGSAGFDLYATKSLTIHPGAHFKIATGVACALPAGTGGFVWPRSGLAVNYGIDTLAGLIDSDYRGEIHVCGINFGARPVEIKEGDRIAQLVVSPIYAKAVQVDDLGSTERGAGGFGSTGL